MVALQAIYERIKANSGEITVGVIILLSVIQISPIKLNPWNAIMKIIRNILTGDIKEALLELETKLDKHIAESDERDLRKRRESILDFASAIASGRNYSEEQYNQMLKECDDYTMYCEEKHFVNSVAEESIALIRSAYRTHKANNDFLKSIYYITPKEAKE